MNKSISVDAGLGSSMLKIKLFILMNWKLRIHLWNRRYIDLNDELGAKKQVIRNKLFSIKCSIISLATAYSANFPTSNKLDNGQKNLTKVFSFFLCSGFTNCGFQFTSCSMNFLTLHSLESSPQSFYVNPLDPKIGWWMVSFPGIFNSSFRVTIF